MRKSCKGLLGLMLVLSMLLGMVIPASAAAVEDTITPVVVRSAKAYESGKKTSRGIMVPHNEKELVVPISISETGLLDLTLSYNKGNQPFIYLDCALYADADCTEKIGHSMDLVYGEASVSNRFAVTGKTTVYFKIVQHRRSGILGPGHYRLQSVLYSGGDRTLKADTAYVTAIKDADQIGVYKVTAEKSGLLTFTVQGDAGKTVSIYTTLLNSKKKAISEESYTMGDGAASKVYAVSKGNYYIKLRVASARNDVLQLSYTGKSCKDESGKTASEATALKLSEDTKFGYLGASSKKGNADWYKVKLSKSGTLTVEVSAIGDGSVMLMVTNKAGKEAWFGSKRIEVGENSFTTAELKKGTYYIKVCKDSAKAGLSYRISVK